MIKLIQRSGVNVLDNKERWFAALICCKNIYKEGFV